MTMVTGDDFLSHLLHYLRNAQKPVTLKLNQQCLIYLAEKLEDLAQQRAAGLDPSVNHAGGCTRSEERRLERAENVGRAYVGRPKL